MKVKVIFLFLVLQSVHSCKDKSTQTCDITKAAPVVKVEGSITGTVGNPMVFIVYFGCENGCAQSGEFTETVSGNTRTIAVNVLYKGCVCTMVAPIFTKQYSFIPTSTGIFILNFLGTATNNIIDTLIVK